MAGKFYFRAKMFASRSFKSGMYNGVGATPPSGSDVTISLKGAIARFMELEGITQSNVAEKGNAQRNIGPGNALGAIG